MSNASIALAYKVDKVLDTNNTNEGWVVKKMRSMNANRIVAILPNIYQNVKVQYFNYKSAMMIFRVDHGESINWVAIMYSQLIKELIKWEKCQKKND